jgi:hypothetical protein
MAVYKVPQDVEAEDKLIGPFSFRQFIYLIIAALGILMAYLLSQLFIGLLIIPLPIILLFLALALPLRKDQPMETYLIAIVRFYLKPRLRMWQPDGAMGLVRITAPNNTEAQLTKDFGSDEAAQRLSYLAQVVDTRGWSTRGVMDGSGSMSAAMIDDVAAEAQNAEDVLDDNASVSRTFDSMIAKNNTNYKQSVTKQFQQAMHEPPGEQPQVFTSQYSMDAFQQATQPAIDTPPASHYVPGPTNNNGDDSAAANVALDYNPYPNSMHQRVITPGGNQPAPNIQPKPAEKPQAPSEPAVSPDIMRLASNNDLSISAIAREAHRIEDKDEGEVVISLR